MMKQIQSVGRKNWTYFWMRWALMPALVLLIVLAQERAIDSLAAIQDLLEIAAINALVSLVLLALFFVKPVKPYLVLAFVLADMVMVGTFVWPEANNALVVAGVTGMVVANNVLRLSGPLAIASAVAIIATSVAAMSFAPRLGWNIIQSNLLAYAPLAELVISFAALLVVWASALDEARTTEGRAMRKEVDETREQMEAVRTRSRAVAEMAAALNSSLDYFKVLDAALDIGRLSLRANAKHRVVSLVLLIEGTNDLRIANSRGLSHLDESRTLSSQRGVIGRALHERQPIINGPTETDPELGRLVAFKHMLSVLCIPLTIGLDTYGVLVYGSSEENAFVAESLDTIKAIGSQATIALQNAVLYSTLMEEKERLIAIEESARKALVRDLHDVPTQTISAVAMGLGILPRLIKERPQEAMQEIERLREMSVRATTEIRHVMFALRPLALETQGLAAALAQLAEKMMTTYRQHVVIKTEPNALACLEQKQEGPLFYLIEEAVNNGRKYAKAQQIHVVIQLTESNVVLRIIDNGEGFDSASLNENYERRGSFGMVNMRERAEMIGGHFEINSKPGKGTVVKVTVPVKVKESLTALSEPVVADVPRKKKLEAPRKQYSGPLSPSR